jgi:large subunit ribosomal protein L4
MPEVAVVTVAGEPVEPIHLRDDVFGIEPHEAVLHQAVVRQLADRRQGTASTKTRGFVRGSTRKVWRQKGSGRARQGSRRAPHWRGGGVVFGPHPRSYRQKMPRKMRSIALRSALSSVVREERLVLLDELGLDTPSTRSLRDILFQVAKDRSVLLVLHDAMPNVRLSARNLPHVRTVGAAGVSVLDLLRADRIVMAVAAARQVEARFPLTNGRAVAAAEAANGATTITVATDTAAVAEPSEE